MRSRLSSRATDEPDGPHVAIPGPKAAHFILIQPHLPFGLFQAYFDAPPTTCDTHRLVQRVSHWPAHPIVGAQASIGEAASEEERERNAPSHNPTGPLSPGCLSRTRGRGAKRSDLEPREYLSHIWKYNTSRVDTPAGDVNIPVNACIGESNDRRRLPYKHTLQETVRSLVRRLIWHASASPPSFSSV